MISREQADHFAEDWISAWNSHDLDRILSHYTDDFTMSSPKIAVIAQEPTGTLRGKAKIRAYWQKALALAPTLRFELISTLVGSDSVAIHYKSARGPAIEVFFFNAEGLVYRASAHYE